MSADVLLELRDVTVALPDRPDPVLAGVDLAVEEGELLLVSGPTGSGKSTLLGVVAGLVPRFSGGELTGDLLLDGTSIVRTPPRERAGSIGYVGQDPAAGFVTDTVEEELAYGMEQLGLAPATMRRRIEETLDLFGIAELRDRDLRTLSGGQQQRVALGSVLTMHPRLLVLDEPTSALDPTAAEDVLATLTRLVHDLGVSVLLAEHRLERVVPFADRVVLLRGDGTVVVDEPGVVLAGSPVVPPIIELGRALGWSPLPLTVRDARRRARSLGLDVASAPSSQPASSDAPGAPAPTAPAAPSSQPVGAAGAAATPTAPTVPSSQPARRSSLTTGGQAHPRSSDPVGAATPTAPTVPSSQPARRSSLTTGGQAHPRSSDPVGAAGVGAERAAVRASRVSVVRGGAAVLGDVDVALRAGTVTALMGRNGAGKSTLLWTLQGTQRRTGGRVEVAGEDPATLGADRRRELVGLLPQSAADLLYLETVDDECRAGGPLTRRILDSLVPGIPGDRHPRDLSEGQRLALALSLVLAADPPVLLLDEPTRGLDYPAKRALAAELRRHAEHGRAVLVATHDVEFTAQVADDVVVLADGEVVSSGPVRQVVAESPSFAPQVTKVLGPPWLTVDEVVVSLAEGTAVR